MIPIFFVTLDFGDNLSLIFSSYHQKTTPKAPPKKKKKGPKAKKVTTKGRKPRYIEDGKDDSKKNDDGFKCGACKDVHTAIEALKGNYIKPNSFRCNILM